MQNIKLIHPTLNSVPINICKQNNSIKVTSGEKSILLAELDGIIFLILFNNGSVNCTKIFKVKLL